MFRVAFIFPALSVFGGDVDRSGFVHALETRPSRVLNLLVAICVSAYAARARRPVGLLSVAATVNCKVLRRERKNVELNRRV